jgi:tRNA (guanine10-N2)-methyltransferase
MKYLVLFVNTLGRLTFRDNELKSLLEMRGITNTDMRWVRDSIDGDETAFMEIELPTEDDAKFLGSRSVSIKGIFEPWGSGSTCDECLAACKAYPASLKDPYLAEGTTFKINIVSIGGTIEDAERTKMIQSCFEYMDFKGKVLMDQTRKGVRAGKGPRAQNQFWWLEDVGSPPHISTSKGLVPHRRWFAREVALGSLLAPFPPPTSLPKHSCMTRLTQAPRMLMCCPVSCVCARACLRV